MNNYKHVFEEELKEEIIFKENTTDFILLSIFFTILLIITVPIWIENKQSSPTVADGIFLLIMALAPIIGIYKLISKSEIRIDQTGITFIQGGITERIPWHKAYNIKLSGSSASMQVITIWQKHIKKRQTFISGKFHKDMPHFVEQLKRYSKKYDKNKKEILSDPYKNKRGQEFIYLTIASAIVSLTILIYFLSIN